MKFRWRLQTIRINIEESKALIHKHMMEMLAHAALDWVSAAEQPVPVWTGASKATFLQLAHAVGFDIPISPSTTAPSDATGFGEALSEGKLEPIDADKGQYFFTYSTRLEHLIENEYTDANTARGLHLKHPGPYHFQELGKAAFEAFARDVRLPPPVIETESHNG